MNWQKEYIQGLIKKFNLLTKVKNDIVNVNDNLDNIIKELNNIKEIARFILKIYIVRNRVISMTFHLVAKSDFYIQLDILNNNSKNKKIDINFKYIEEEEYNSLPRVSTKPSVFGYNIWKHSVGDDLVDYYSTQFEWD